MTFFNVKRFALFLVSSIDNWNCQPELAQIQQWRGCDNCNDSSVVECGFAAAKAAAARTAERLATAVGREHVGEYVGISRISLRWEFETRESE
jgi:hypothetical protein